MNKAPIYYQQGGRDLYDFFIEKYGLDTWKRHIEMECIQYLIRAPLKGSYNADIRKVIVICERLLSEGDKNGESS